MKNDTFKVLLYLKKNSPDKSGKVPVMGRITVGRTMAQFSLKISCSPSLWDARASRLAGKSHEAVETNDKIEKLLLSVHSAYEKLAGRKLPFDATAVKELYQGCMDSQMTLLALLGRHIQELRERAGIDINSKTIYVYVYAHRALSKFIKKTRRTNDVAFGQLNEQFIREFQDFVLGESGYSTDTARHYLIILKKMCKIAFNEGFSERLHFAHHKLPEPKINTPKALSRENFEKIRDLDIPYQCLYVEIV